MKRQGCEKDKGQRRGKKRRYGTESKSLADLGQPVRERILSFLVFPLPDGESVVRSSELYCGRCQTNPRSKSCKYCSSCLEWMEQNITGDPFIDRLLPRLKDCCLHKFESNELCKVCLNTKATLRDNMCSECTNQYRYTRLEDFLKGLVIYNCCCERRTPRYDATRSIEKRMNDAAINILRRLPSPVVEHALTFRFPSCDCCGSRSTSEQCIRCRRIHACHSCKYCSSCADWIKQHKCGDPFIDSRLAQMKNCCVDMIETNRLCKVCLKRTQTLRDNMCAECANRFRYTRLEDFQPSRNVRRHSCFCKTCIISKRHLLKAVGKVEKRMDDVAMALLRRLPSKLRKRVLHFRFHACVVCGDLAENKCERCTYHYVCRSCKYCSPCAEWIKRNTCGDPFIDSRLSGLKDCCLNKIKNNTLCKICLEKSTSLRDKMCSECANQFRYTRLEDYPSVCHMIDKNQQCFCTSREYRWYEALPRIHKRMDEAAMAIVGRLSSDNKEQVLKFVPPRCPCCNEVEPRICKVKGCGNRRCSNCEATCCYCMNCGKALYDGVCSECKSDSESDDESKSEEDHRE